MTDRLPTLSIGMPVYNGEQYLKDSLDSILGQSFGDFELVIADNGSTDASAEICNSYAAADARIRFSRNEKNLGATANYNTVAERARGKYFKWASSNDLCQPGFFEKCVTVLEQNPDVVLCYPRTRLFDDETGNREDYDDNLDLRQDDPCVRFTTALDQLRLNNIMNGVARREEMQSTRLIPDIYCGDQIVIAELALMGKFVEVPEFLFFRRMDKASATHLKSAEDVHLHFDPTGKTAMLYQVWKHFFLLFKAVRESNIQPHEKRRLYRALGVRARWKRYRLANDVVEAAQWHWRAWTS